MAAETSVSSSAGAGSSPLDQAAARGGVGVLGYLREWMDALIIAFVLAMFIRTFVVELFKIPSGSMSPTLLGDPVAEGVAYDEQGESQWYLLIHERQGPGVQKFRKDKSGNYRYEGKVPHEQMLTLSQQTMMHSELHVEEHRIFVNKFAYWFKQPKRGDITVFRVPFKLKPTSGYERNGAEFEPYAYKRSQSVYVKRTVAFEGERVEIKPDEHLYINGQKATDPPILGQLQYKTTDRTPVYDVIIPENHVLALGDNSDNSADSRYWGPLPEDNLRGKAFLRYWPWRKARFLN